jgi:hypothetical protein
MSILVLAAVSGLVVGFVFGVPPSVVDAACGPAANPNCGADLTLTSSVTVNHIVPGEVSDTPVEPDDTDSWTVNAVWATPYSPASPLCSCQETSASVTVDVQWDGSTKDWVATCTGCGVLGPIFAVSVCPAGSSCGSGGEAHASAYELIVDVAKTNGTCGVTNIPYNLQRVEYDTTTVDDGDTVNFGTCREVSAVSPTSQDWSATDTGGFECAFSCAASGPSVTITYE